MNAQQKPATRAGKSRVAAKVAYEQPLTERVRTFLRLETLLDQASHHVQGETLWDSRAALATLLELQSLLGKGDIRNETMKEMERHAQVLTRLRNRPNVDGTRLGNILESLRKVRTRLEAHTCQPGKELRENEFLSSVKNRATIPGGACGFDLPGLQYWLHLDTATRNRDLQRWLDTIDPLARAIRLVLMLLRESAAPEKQTAHAGMFQMTLNTSQQCQLIRVLLPADTDMFPEISGGRHRFVARFMQRNAVDERPQQTKNDVEFELAHCQF